MNILLMIVLGLGLGPVVLAVAIRFLPPLHAIPLGRRVATATFIAGLIPWIGAALLMLTSLFPFHRLDIDMGQRALTPLVLGAVSVLLLMVPASHPRNTGTATLASRRASRFLSRRWVWTLSVLVIAILALTLAAGVASDVDENGHRTMYWTKAGSSSYGTQIYGWYFSAPSLIALAVLLALVALTVFMISVPAWSADAETDASVRRARATNVCRILAGVLLIHLSAILNSLAGTSSLTGMSRTAELGEVTTVTPFAALQPFLQWSGWAAFITGVTLCLITTLLAIPTHGSRGNARS